MWIKSSRILSGRHITENWLSANGNWISVNIILLIMHFGLIRGWVDAMFGNSQNPHPQAGTQPGVFFPGYIVRVLWSCLKGMIVSVVGALGRFYSQGEGNGPYEVQQSWGLEPAKNLEAVQVQLCSYRCAFFLFQEVSLGAGSKC